MGPGWKVGRLAGIDLAIHPSWLVIAFLVTYSLAVFQVPAKFQGWGSSAYWIVAVSTALLFFASVLAHEFSHALVARRKPDLSCLEIRFDVTTIRESGPNIVAVCWSHLTCCGDRRL